MDTTAIKFPENVLVIDAFFLNALIKDMRKFYETKLNRKIDEVNIPMMLDYFALDMGMREDAQETKETAKCLVIWIYDSNSEKLEDSQPSDINKELNGKGFDDNIGNFEMIGAPCKNLVTRKDLALNILDMLFESKDVKRIGVVPEESEYEKEVFDKMNSAKEKDPTIFVLSTNDFVTEDVNVQSVLYPILAGMGIRGEELA